MRRAILVLCAACAAGCGSNSDPATTPTPATDTGVDAAPSTSTKVLVTNGARPVGGVTLRVLDKSGAELARGVGGDDGVVTLENFEFGAELVTVIGTKPQHSVEIGFASKALVEKMHAAIGGKPGEPFRWFMFPHAATMPRLSGKLSGATMESAGVHVVGGTAWQGAAAGTYSARAPVDRKTKLVALEFAGVWTGRSLEQSFGKWIGVDVDAMSGDRTMDLDLSAHPALPIKKTNVKLEISGGDGGPLGGTSTAYAFTTCGAPDVIACGFPSKIAPTADASAFDMELSYVDVPGLEPGNTLFRIQRPEDGAYSERLFTTRPTDGMVVKDFDTPLAITAAKLSISEPLSFEGVPPGANVLLNGSKANGDLNFRVFIEASLTAAPVQLPPLPEDVRAMIPATSQGRVITTRDFAPGTFGAPTKAAVSRQVTLTP